MTMELLTSFPNFLSVSSKPHASTKKGKGRIAARREAEKEVYGVGEFFAGGSRVGGGREGTVRHRKSFQFHFPCHLHHPVPASRLRSTLFSLLKEKTTPNMLLWRYSLRFHGCLVTIHTNLVTYNGRGYPS
ncbi:hypothetical protein E1B28_008070 [Marasmius oreades]|uniref:Uncharacterized protein n=1 Tax=Marasmius oreades TaxID=181124 RepID=A0A9P7UW32_9AGAR|nr:uncharacterized protein E1B28_008070 [Marasmius oreades]KAG7094474.1 hypothetical protein E1B28_008070 [Marasmius oreades]